MHKPIKAVDIKQSIENYLQRQRLQAYVRASVVTSSTSDVNVERSNSQSQSIPSAPLVPTEPNTKIPLITPNQIDPISPLHSSLQELCFIVTDYDVFYIYIREQNKKK